MPQTAPPAEQVLSPKRVGSRDEQESVRRALVIFIAVLALVAVGLLVLLFVVVGPKDEDTSGVAGEVAGYPIQVVKSIFGPDVNDAFAKPLGVAFDPEGNVWVSDTGKSRVVIMTTGGRSLRVIADREGPGALASPYGIAPDPARDRMYVADWTAGAVLAYSSAGRFLERFPNADQDLTVFGADGFTPYDVKVAGSKIVAASNDGLYFFDRTGNVVARWGSGERGKRVGDFNFPDALEIDNENERIYVTDTLNRRVVALGFDGRVEWVSGSPDEAGKITGFWQLPRGVVMGPDGVILVVDTFRFDNNGLGIGHIVALSDDGRLVSEFGRAGDEEDAFGFPDKLAAGPDGLYAIADREHNRVLVFSLGPLPEPARSELDLYEGALQQPESVEVGSPVGG